MKKLILLLSLIGFFACNNTSKTVVNDSNFNKGWLFAKDSIIGAEKLSFDDSQWRKLDLPHDWAIEGPFDNKYNARTGGLPVHGTAWYRKHFTLSKENENKKIAIEFDGAMNNTKVWVNDQYVGERPFGYIGFEFDITSFVKFGEENVIAVQLSPEDLAARWYSGAGIYRNVRLKIKNDIHIPQWGTFIKTPKANKEEASVVVNTKVKNTTSKPASVKIITTIYNPENLPVATQESIQKIEANEITEVEQIISVKNPKLWNIGKGVLYTAKSEVKINDVLYDSKKTNFGIRTINFDANKGFSLNGKRVQFNGVCMHHDLGPLGTAVNYRATQRQMQIMQSMGVNALRTSHNPPSPEMLQVCDELGIVVIDEAFDEWKIGKIPNGYHKYFDEWHEKDLRDMIKRDRNHPSVVMWSIGNEILEQGKKEGWKLTKILNDICHDEDNSRPTTAGFNYYPAPFKNKLAENIDIVGMNYWPLHYAEIKKNHPNMIIYGSETSSQTSSRGVYHLPIDALPVKSTNHVSSYDVIVGPPWAYHPDAEFEVQDANDFLLGEFIWTGFDYLGEPTPYGGRDNSTNGYWNDDWPSRSSYFAPVDLCGFPKDRYYLYQSQWTTKPMVHVLPHWNWEGMEGKTIPVFSYTNCNEVELFVNGKSYGKKVKGKDFTEIPAEYHGFEKGTFKSKYRLSWNVPYSPGAIKVIGYKNGKAVAEKEIKTADKPSQIKLTADRTKINADGNDLSFITVDINDNNNNFCPKADNLVTFKIDGPATLAAVGNGDQTSLASFQVNNRKAFNGKCLLVIKSTKEKGTVTVTATSKGLKSKTITIVTK